MSKKVKNFIFPGTTLLISFYFSVFFTIGIIAGYFGTDLFYKKLVKPGRVRRLIFPFGNGEWRIHLHHWILGGLGILLAYFFSSLSIFWIGIFGGLICHDFYTDKEWYKVIYRKELTL